MVSLAFDECAPPPGPNETVRLSLVISARIEWDDFAGANSRAMLDSDTARSIVRGRPIRARWTNRRRRSAGGSAEPPAWYYRTLAPCGDQPDIQFPQQ